MQRLIIALIIVIGAAATYLFLQPDPLLPASAPDRPPAVSDEVRSRAQTHIDSLTSKAAAAVIPMEQADHFVTGEQLLALPQNKPLVAARVTADTDGSEAQAFAADLPRRPDPSSDSTVAPELALDRMRLQELLQNPDQAANQVFYIHSVRPDDRQGIWGILRRGLIDTFARGIRIQDRSRLLSAAIPEDADALLEDGRSSWLGRLLHDKVKQTWIYNHQQGLLGQNPDVIHPGQQLVIVRFSEEELINIYNHFSATTR